MNVRVMQWVRLVCLAVSVAVSGCAVNTQSSQIRSAHSHRPVPVRDMNHPVTHDVTPANPQPYNSLQPHTAPHASSNSGVASLLQQAAQARAAGDFAKAQTLAERAQGLEPRQAHSYLELARIYQARGDNARSRQMALRGLQFSDDDPALQQALHLLSEQ